MADRGLAANAESCVSMPPVLGQPPPPHKPHGQPGVDSDGGHRPSLDESLAPVASRGESDLIAVPICDNMYTNGASYCAFFELLFDDDRYTHFIARIFGSLRNGYSLDQAIMRDAWADSQCTGSYPGGIDEDYGPSQYRDFADDPASAGLIDNCCFNWRVPMPPYHNLRVQGNPIAMRLNPY